MDATDEPTPYGLLRSLCSVPADADWDAQIGFAAIAVLTQVRFNIFSAVCRLAEIEFYLTSAAHPDPFTHGHETQLKPSHWYFHRQGSGYRGGSFKGLDFTFSDGDAHAGVLIRSIDTPDGLISGPSLVVDYILRQSGFKRVADLDAHVESTGIWEASAPLRFELIEPTDTKVYRSGRVGLSAATAKDELGRQFASKPYRFLTEPRRVKKGRSVFIPQLALDGYTVDDIRELTGSPRSAIKRCLSQQSLGK